MTINDTADELIRLLAEAATAPAVVSPYLTQMDLMEVLGVRTHAHMSQVVSRAAVDRVPELYPGYGLLISRQYGYRMADDVVLAELRAERARLRRALTEIRRAIVASSTTHAGPESQLRAGQLTVAAHTIAVVLAEIDVELAPQ